MMESGVHLNMDVSVENPFPGLRPFEMEEYHLFFGREGQSDELLARLGRTRFLAVVGTSGSGKSSLVRAGLLPALYGGLMAGAGSGWRVALFRPGGDPVGELARALGAEGVLGTCDDVRTTIIETTLRRGARGIVDAVRQAQLPAHENVLVVVDQFEELFRFKEAGQSASDDASAFVKLLLEASTQRELSVYVVLTMRSDFLGDCARFQGLPEAINTGQYLIPRMTRDERSAAITGPVAVGGGEITQPLVNRLLNDVGDNPDQLPILQHALMRTWDFWTQHRRDGEPLDLRHYEAIGTMSDALSRHADEAYGELPDEDHRIIAEKMFKALTEKGADNRETRRPTRLAELCEITGASLAEVVSVIELFRREGRSFLMPPAEVALDEESVIDISHESLIRNWTRLKKWVDEEAQSARIYRRLAESTVLHREGKEGLLNDPALQIALDWREQARPNAVWGRRYHPEYAAALTHLDASRAHRDAQVAAEREREQRELERTRAFAEQQAHSNRKLRALMVAFACLSLFAMATAAYAYVAKKQAESSERNALDLKDEAVKQKERINELLDTTKAEKQRALDAETAAKDAEVAAKDAETAAKIDKQKALDAEVVAKEQAKLAATRLTEALKANRKAVAAEDEAKRNLIGLNTQIQNNHLNRDALALLMRGNIAEAERAFDYLTGLYTDDPSSLSWAKSNLGSALRQLGRLDESIRNLKEAKTLQEQAIRVDRTRRGDDPEYLDTLTWLGHAHRDKGEYQLAHPLYADVLKIRRDGDRDADVAIGLEHLARNYVNLGQPEEAAKIYDEVLERRRKNPSSPDLIAALKEAAEFHFAYDDDGAAVAAKLYDEALRNQEAFLETDDPNIADTFDAMAQLYEGTQFQIRADRLNALAKEMRTLRLYKGDSLEKVPVMEKLARRYVAVGRLERAAEVRGGAHEMFVRLKGREDQGAINNLVDFGNFFRELAKLAPNADARKSFYDRGSAIYRQAFEISARKSFTREAVRALDAHAAIELEQQNFAEAERLYKQVLNLRERTPEVDFSPEFSLSENLDGLAQSAVGLGKDAEAEAYLQRALKVFASAKTQDLKYLSSSREFDARILRHSMSARLAEVYRARGQFKEADRLYRLLDGQLRGDITRHDLTGEYTARRYLDIIESAGRFYTERGDMAAAESFYRLVWPREIRPAVGTVVVWPDAFSKSLPALAPVSLADNLIRILEAYADLLKKAGREKEAGFISYGISHLQDRKYMEGTTPSP